MLARLRILFFSFLLTWIILIFRLFYWQVGSFRQLSFFAKQQHLIKKEISSPRGTIFSSDGFPLALSKQFYLLFAQPDQIKNPQKVFEKVKKYTLLDEKKFLEICQNPKIRWYPLAKKILEDQKEELEKSNIEGLGYEPVWQRFYPEASMTAHLLGFVGADDGGNEKGYFGLEGFYDRELRGISGERLWEKDIFGRPIIFGQILEEKPRRGRDLQLYLNRSLQFMVEEKLKKGITQYQAISGSVVVMDPYSGGVLAMASFPSFDPFNFASEDENFFPNPVVSSTFEPGSIFKPIVMAAAIDLGLVNQTTVCDTCSGPVRIGEFTIRTWNDQYFPESTMIEVIQHSDNVGMVFVSRKLGVKNLLNYLKKFGIGRQSGIDLEGEASPPLRDESLWYEIDLATAGFGQGIAVTPIQIVRAISAIANGGKLVVPQIVEKISEEGKIIWTSKRKEEQIIKQVTAKVLKQMLVNAVEKGEAKWAKPKGYQIAGKTGTSQIPLYGHYDEEKTIASFIGFAPANNPKFTMLVTLREPKTSPWGSETAAPLWFEIALDIFRILGTPPS